MNSSMNREPGRAGHLTLAGRIAALARRVAAIVAECNYAQRRLAALTLTPERYQPGMHQAADTYAEFLYRASGPLLREPPAARRASGQLVG